MAKRGLGKGLAAVFESNNASLTPEIDENSIVSLKISMVEPNRTQPRHDFDEEKLDILADSVREHGVISPIIVTDLNNGFYRIVAGERRWRAAKKAGLKEIPAIVRSYDQLTTMEVALIENLQREDLNPIEEAMGYKYLIDNFDLTQDAVSKKVSKSRSAVANALRLLTLNSDIQALLREGAISSGHARAILSVESDEGKKILTNKIMFESLSVRKAEEFAKRLNSPTLKKPSLPMPAAFEHQIKEIQTRASEVLGTKVKILNGAKKGKIEIEYYGEDDLNRVLNLLKL